MKGIGTGVVIGVPIGIIVTLFTSLLTELIVLVALGAVIFYFGRRRWRNKQDTPSTTKKFPFESP